MNANHRQRLLASTLFVSASLLVAAPVLAQDAPASSDDAPEAEAIVVTGSRIARPELDAASPVAVISSAQIQAQGITNVQDLAQKLPQVGIPGLSRSNTNFATTGNGISSINLRNLGDSRTLVLVNGRRFVAGVAGTAIVDVNNIPADFVDHIDVVTGGASAVYGSDAIAGVVNFVLKDKIEGIIARAQYGISDEGDSRNYTASISGGYQFGPDDRGSIIGNFTYSKDAGLLSRKRKISSQDCNLTCGPESYSSYAQQGRFSLFNDDTGLSQGLFTFNPDNSVVDGFPIGYGFNRNSLRRITTPVERYLGAASAKYEVSDGITLFAEGTYAKTKSASEIEPFALDSINDLGMGYGIDNPFIPQVIRDRITAANSDNDPDNDITSIQFRRRQNEVYSRSNRNSRETFRITGGVKGDITDKWNFEVSAVYGQLKDHTATEDINLDNYRNAVDAITDENGNIVCRSATARAAGCVPINLFGYNTASAAASQYVQSAIPRSDDIKNTEFVATASLNGTLAELPYGDLKVSVGAEYRREKSVDNWDALTNAGNNSGNKTPDTVGKYNVKELFGEIDIPILSGLPFAESLSAQGQARYSDYSTIGHVFSWSAGGEWSPVKGLRFRGNYAVANRAPNINELFSAAAETFPSVSDPCNHTTATSGGDFGAICRAIPGVAAAIARDGEFAYTLADQQGINGFDGGNRDLQEEKGKTLTVGGVFQPTFLPGFSFSADYFRIKISNAIGLIDRDTSIRQCLLLNLPQFCDNVIRDGATGLIKTVNAQNINIAKRSTSGIDFNLRYGHAVGLFNDDKFDLNVLYTWTMKYKRQSDPSAPVENGLGNLFYGEQFKHKINTQLMYTVGKVSLNWTATYLSKMTAIPEDVLDTTVTDLTDAGLTQAQAERLLGHNKIKARLYHDVQARVRTGENDRFELFLGVDNLFDRKPPILEDGLYVGGISITGTTTAADVYDPIGRRFYAGVQVKF